MGLLGEWKKKAQGLLNPQTALDATRGLLMGATTDVLGYPVDVLSDAMRPFGYNVAPSDTVGSSDWLANKLTAPTGSGAETAGRFASGLLTPGPQELLQATGLLKKSAPVQELITYHGSPHRINNVDAEHPAGRFDLSKVGTGEGAQAYGHGVYLAESPDVARSYQSVLSPDYFTVNGAMPDTIGIRNDHPALLFAQRGDLDKYIEIRGRDIGKPGPGGASAADDIGIAEKLRGAEVSKVSNPGHLYTVDLPDEHIANMLDWDAPLSEQSIKDAITPENMGLTLKELPSGYMGFVDDTGKPVGTFQKGGTPESFRARWIENAQKQTGQGVYSWLSTDKQQSSKLLGRAGIPGIKYFDGGSRAAGEGTRNFVIFDGDTAKILKRE